MLECDLTPIEVKIMKVIWETDEELHLKKIQTLVNERFNASWMPQTISTYLAHLVRKGYLSMERHGKVFLYTAEVSEKDFRTQEVNNLIEYFSDFGMVDMLKACPDESFTPESIKEMKKMLDVEELRDGMDKSAS